MHSAVPLGLVTSWQQFPPAPHLGVHVPFAQGTLSHGQAVQKFPGVPRQVSPCQELGLGFRLRQ